MGYCAVYLVENLGAWKEEHMRLSVKLFGVRYVLKVYFPPERYIKWLPAIFLAKVGPAMAPMGKNT